jgi:peroxiredoxin
MNLGELPDSLPIPEDDGAADHLAGRGMPDLSLRATNNQIIQIGELAGLVVLYIYPRTGRPDTPLPDGWNDIPGARGCTPQSCSFREHYAELQALGAGVFGVSSQETDYQLEAKLRLHLPFELLSDAELLFKNSLRLPTFTLNGMELYKRMTLITRDGVIEKVLYPVFPPDQSADAVIEWLRLNAG